MHPADLIKHSIKLTQHPIAIWFDRLFPLACLLATLYYAWIGSYVSAVVWGITAILGVVLSVFNVNKIMQKILAKVVTRRGL